MTKAARSRLICRTQPNKQEAESPQRSTFPCPSSSDSSNVRIHSTGSHSIVYSLHENISHSNYIALNPNAQIIHSHNGRVAAELDLISVGTQSQRTEEEETHVGRILGEEHRLAFFRIGWPVSVSTFFPIISRPSLFADCKQWPL